MKAILFDLYQTLIFEKTQTFYSQLVKELRVSPDLFLKAYSRLGAQSMTGELKGMKERVFAACKLIKSDHTEHEISELIPSLMESYYEAIALYADATSVIMEAKGDGYHLAIVSNASSYSHEIIQREKLFSHFDRVVFSCDLGVMKPAPSIYLKACAELRVAPEDCYFVGDGGHEEIRGASEVGMKTLLIERPDVRKYYDRDYLHAHYVVRSLEEAYRVIGLDGLNEASRHNLSRGVA